MSYDETLISYILNPWDGTLDALGRIELPYSNLDFTPSSNDPYISTSGDVFKVYVDGVRVYRSSDQNYAAGEGFLEDGDVNSGSNSTLSGVSNSSWNDTSDSVWTIDTTNQKVLLNPTAIQATVLYGSSNLDLSFTGSVTVIEIKRSVQNLKVPAIDFSNSSILTEQALDSSIKNVFHIAQEAIEFSKATVRQDAFGNFDVQEKDLTNVSQLIVQNAPTLDKNVVTKTYLEDTWLSPADKTNAATVQTLSSEIASIGNNPYKAQVQTVADATYKAQVQTVADATYKGKIETVADATYKAQVETLADATYKADIETVADSTYVAEIQTVAQDLQQQVSEIKTVADDLQTGTGFSEIKTVADDLQLDTTSKVKTVADDLQGTNTIGTLADATYKAQVQTVADATYKAKVEAVATDLLGDDNIGTVVTNIANVNTVAAGIADVNNYADTYYGSHDFTTAGDPTGTFNAGDLIFDSGNNVVKVYNGTSWQNATSSVEGVIATEEYTGDGVEQHFAFTVNQGMELVYLNGVKMLRGTDYECVSSDSSTTGVGDTNAATHIYFPTVPVSDDVINFVGFGQSDNSLAVPVSGGTFTGNVTVNGTLTPGTLDVSAGTLTLANDQISGDAIDGGTISDFASTGIDDNATSTAVTIDSSGNVELKTTNAKLILPSGGGIDFGTSTTGSGTVTGGVLDDYEEGTFEPLIIGTTTAGVGTYSIRYGKYIKIGSLVYIEARLGWSAHTGDGNMKFDGFPFNNGNIYANLGVSFRDGLTVTAGHIVKVTITPSSNSASILEISTGTDNASAVALDTSVADFAISGCYNVI